jgi:FAD/FMN-containing dehydrogenase
MQPDRDFGNVVSKGKQNTRTTRDGDEIALLLREATATGTPVNTRGASHSMNGHSLNAGGFRLHVTRPTEQSIRMLDETRVDTPAGVYWADLEAYLNRRGRTCPVLTDNLLSSVGGTLSVGGVGSRSLVAGRQIDWVERIRLILPDGQPIECSHQENSELFRHALGGLGLVGVIDRVTLQTLDYRPYLAIYEFQHSSLHHAMELLVRLSNPGGEWPSALRHFNVEGPILETGFICSRVALECRTKPEARAYLTRTPTWLQPCMPFLHGRRMADTAAFIRWTTKRGHVYYSAMGASVKHLWGDWFFVGRAAYLEFVRYVETELLRRYGLQDLLAGFGLLLKTFPESPRFPLSYAYNVSERFAYYFYLAYCFPAHVPARMERIQACLREAQAKAHQLGGRIYLNSWQDFDLDTLDRVYGEDYEGLVRLKKRIDPAFILNRDVLRVHEAVIRETP